MKRFLTILILLSLAMHLHSQDLNVREKAYLQLNSDYFITGETLYFSAFVTSAATSQLSDLSSILYVELVGEDRAVFQQKIKLSHGRGYGEFFMPSLVSTGTYQLIAYTRWMRNFGTYFQQGITIVNPFEEYERPETGEMTATFYPESGGLVNNFENHVAYRISEGGQGVSVSGKIVNTSGEKLADIQTNKNGIGQFAFTPRADQEYQAIIEDATGQFKFFNLPNTRTSQVIQVEEKPGYFSIIVADGQDRLIPLEISDGQNLVYSRETESNMATRIYKKDIKPGAYIISTKQSERIFLYRETQIGAEPVADKYQTRSLVRIPIVVPANTSASVSVRKKSTNNRLSIVESTVSNNVNLLPGIDSENTFEEAVSATWSGTKRIDQGNEVTFLPEVRGELVTGKISDSPESISETLVTFSTIGEHYQLRAAKADKSGNFIIQIDPFTAEKEAYVAVHSSDSSVSLTLDGAFLEDYPEFDYSPVMVDSLTAVALTERSIRNQVQNAYYEFDPGEPEEAINTPKQFGEFTKLYVLDEFNRFPKMHEHFIEFIPEVVARQNSSRSKLKVLSRYLLPYDLDPLILVDGVPTSPKHILEFSPYKIKSIGVINNRIFNGPLIADGLVSFHTFRGDLHTFDPGSTGLQYTHQGLEQSKNYSFPVYDGTDSSRDRIPDYRDQLYWDPIVSISADTPYTLEFYTSDTEGQFEVVVEGYTTEGKPFLFTKPITVESASPPSAN